jgi:hypothetical protein
LCNSDQLRCWKTVVNVISCGVSATDYPFDEDGFNQSSNLILSAYPNTVGSDNKGCISLNDNCCESAQLVGDFASLSLPTSLWVNITLTLNSGENYNFTSTTGNNSITPCNSGCYDTNNPIFIAPADAQPSPCIILTLVQTIDYCTKTVCWTLNLDTTSDCIGAAAVGNIIDIGCTNIIEQSNNCKCYEYFSAYNMAPDLSNTDTENSLSYTQNFVNSDGPYSLTLTKGIVIDGDLLLNSADATDSYCGVNNVRTIITDVGLYPCQVFNAWFAAYEKPSCVGQFDTHPNNINQDVSDFGGLNPNNNVIYLTPRLAKSLFNFSFYWQVSPPKNEAKISENTRLRFELCRSGQGGSLVPVSTKSLYGYLRTWNNQIKTKELSDDSCSYPIDKNDKPTTEDYASTFFIGIGDICKPYKVFKTPNTGNDYQVNLEPYSQAGIIQNSPSSMFGLRFGSHITNPDPETSQCIC